MSDAWTQHCSPPLPGETPLLYSFIREWFRLAAAGFYSTTEVHGLENMPPNGVPCIVCFNHGNGLADPAVLIRKTPRMVRFCAKDSLWSTPIFKYFIRNSGAVPVYRPGEHGEKAKEMNVEMFRRVIGALRQGDCVGFAPEGVSRFLPYMEQPFKTGLARLALEAVMLSNEAGDPDFCVHLVPVGLIYTHREKFRSDLCMRYMPPVKVDANLIRKHTTADGKVDTFTLAKQITIEISHALDKSTINAPTWDVLNLAITAARLHSPVGTDLSLGQYLTLVRGWVHVLKLGVPAPEGSLPIDPPTPPTAAEAAVAAKLRAALQTYQQALDAKGIKCERVRRAAQHGQALPWYWCVTGMAQRAVLCAACLALAAPGLLLFSPVWKYLKRRERFLLSKGPRWNDSVAEMKMMICGLIGMVFVAGNLMASVYYWSWRPAAFVYYMYVTMRCYEEGVADARSAYTLYKLLLLSPAEMKVLVELRVEAKKAMDPAVSMLPAGVVDHIALPADEARPTRALDYYFPWILARLIMLLARRRKKDWNEVLRLKDHATMDYVS